LAPVNEIGPSVAADHSNAVARINPAFVCIRVKLDAGQKNAGSAGLSGNRSHAYRFAEPRTDAADVMSTIELVDPELRDALALWPVEPLTADSLTRRRANLLKVIGAVPKPDLPDIAADEICVESAFGAEPIRVLTYRPVKSDNPLPAIVHIHGGGFVAGAPEMKDVENRQLASDLRCAIYSVDYRLAPEAPHPAPLEDIYSVFAWLHENAGQLGLDPSRIGIKGESGGGGLAAAAVLYARDQQGPIFAFQHLIYPMIDDRTAVRKDLHPHVGEFVWTQAHNYFGWHSLLGREPGSAGVSPYAAASRAVDVSGLPPTYTSVGGLDLFLEENLTYADRLSRAGVPVEFHMYPRAYHGFYQATNARVTKQAERDAREALRRFLHG
jgi:triacylglycerol lipase